MDTPLYDYLANWETKEFPAALCTLPNGREPTVRDSPADELYLVFLVDKRFPCNGRLALARPYVCHGYDDDNEAVVLPGWVDLSGNAFDHYTGEIHGDDARVVAWRRVELGFDLRKLFPTW